MYRFRMSKTVAVSASLVLALGTVLAAGSPAAAQDAPTTPTGFQADVGASSVTVTWEPSNSDAGVAIYFLTLNGRWFWTVEPIMTFHLAQDQTYSLEVQAQDNNFQRSDWSEPFSFSTPDEFPVTTPGDIGVTDSPGSATVSWDAASSDAGVLDYLVSVPGMATRRVTGTATTFNLPAGGDFDVSVQARDQAYRLSGSSDPVGFTVAPEPGFAPPTAPSNLRASFDSRGRAQLVEWDAASGTGPLTYHLQVEDSGEIESTRDLEVGVSGFVRCTATTRQTLTFFVTATANGFESEPSDPITMCFR